MKEQTLKRHCDHDRSSVGSSRSPTNSFALRQLTEGHIMTTPSEPYTVLIVEDNVELLDILSRALRRIGHFNVVGASDGVTGLEQYYVVHPNCMVIDVKMPGLDGYQLVRALRGDPTTAATPLIILTAMTQDKERFAGLAAGADLYLLKPITPQDLAAAIHRAILISEQERQHQLQTLADDETPSY